MRVNILCRNWREDRILPRMARYLSDALGWNLTASPDLNCDVLYLAGYFEAQLLRTWPAMPVIGFFTHREEMPVNNAKAKLWDEVAKAVNLRIAMCRLYAEQLQCYGQTVQTPLPVERERFTIVERKRNSRPVVGLSGYTYSNKRKGEDLARALMQTKTAQRVEWKMSGRGWPGAVMYPWADMPKFYQSLDVLVCTSRVEGGPLPVLEALSCGVSVVVPSGVGIIDELPDVPGIWRYPRGDMQSMENALQCALDNLSMVNRAVLRDSVAGHTVEAFCRCHVEAVDDMPNGMQDTVNGGLVEAINGNEESVTAISIQHCEPREYDTGQRRGIYVVAFGKPARECARRLIGSIKTHMSDVPVMLCGAEPLGMEDLFVQQPDSDVGGRRAKLKAYELTPAEWQAVLYLDADTEVKAPVYYFFELIESGWEFVICKDPHMMDTMLEFRRQNNVADVSDIQKQIGTLHLMQWNGGVWAFGRNERIARFFRRWQQEWEKYAQRDQGALVRAMYAEPLRMFMLGNQWNTFPKYCRNIESAGLWHYPGDARRWEGLINGRIDSPAAWNAVREFERHGHSQSRSRQQTRPRRNTA